MVSDNNNKWQKENRSNEEKKVGWERTKKEPQKE